MGDAIAVKSLEGDGLAAQTQLLPLAQVPCTQALLLDILVNAGIG